jgi:hypothetical protein
LQARKQISNNVDPSIYSSVDADGTFNISSQTTPAVGTSAFNVLRSLREFLGFS